MNISWNQFWEESKAFAASLDLDGKDRIVIPSLSVYEGLRATVAALILGRDIVFDEKGAAETLERDFLISGEFPEDLCLHLSGHNPIPILRLAKGRTFTFATSGSTSAPKSISRHAEGLLNEIDQLTKLYELKPGERLTSLVRPFHIYGFLHSFLLPLVVGTELLFWNTTQGLPDLDQGFPQISELLICVPSHFNLLTSLWNFSKTKTIVSSGAPLGTAREHRLADYRSRFDSYWEILGSTETGGIAHRRADLHQPFKPFDGLKFESTEEGSWIESPFLAPETRILSQDIFQLAADGTLQHLGRSDRVFKYAGLRHDLGEMEDILRTLSSSLSVICLFEADEAIAQGGVLTAWIEGEKSDLRKGYPPRLPFPKRIHFLPEFPRDSQGKVSLLQLKALTQSP